MDRPLTQSFPEIVEALAGAEADFVVDAELVVPDEQGRADFERLRRRALLRRSRAIERAAVTSAAVLVAFDVLEADGVDVRPLPLHARRGVLRRMVPGARGLKVIDALPTHGEALFAEIVAHDCEGIVGKRLDAPYRSGRQLAWVKIKNARYSRQDALRYHGRR